MTKVKLFAAAVATMALTPAVAADMSAYPHHRHYRHHADWGLPYPISYFHNYGPGQERGSFAYYDGPATVKCYQGAATYLGQDGRRHPCF